MIFYASSAVERFEKKKYQEELTKKLHQKGRLWLILIQKCANKYMWICWSWVRFLTSSSGFCLQLLFICQIDHFRFLAQFVGICRITLPYFIRSIFPSRPVWKGHHQRCRRFARPKIFWVFLLGLGHRLRLGSPRSWLVEHPPISSLIGQIWLRRPELGRRSRRPCARARCCLSLLTFTQATGPECWH